MPVDADDFRRALGQFAAGVTVVTTRDGQGRALGLTVTAFCAVSLDPPLVLVCVDHRSETHVGFRHAGLFGVSILAEGQTDVCKRLATKEPDKFDSLSWVPAPVTGSPLIAEAVAHIDCDLEQQHLAGDHWIVVGRVRHLAAHRDDADPLVFCRGAFGRHQTL